MGRAGRSGPKRKYEWPGVVGQQRVMSGDPAHIRAAACMYGKSHGMKFKTQTVECYLIVRRVK